MRLKALIAVLLGMWVFVVAAPVVRADVAPAEQSLVDQIKQPVDWFTWGADLRIREEYMKNNIDLMSEFDDDSNAFRLRGRLWTQFGPFFTDESLNVPNGLKLYARITAEPRYFAQRPNFPALKGPNEKWEELVLDSLWVEWSRIAALPLSIRAGRQDIVYGKGWVVLDGTPLDGSRTIYMDAVKTTLHLDEYKTDLDLVYANNKARQSRVEPVGYKDMLVNEYDQDVFIAYLKSLYFSPNEVHAYYIYKDEDLVKISKTLATARTVHTVGALVQGTVADNWDYYAEGAYQWGNEAGADRSGWGATAELGYTFKEYDWTPRIYGGYEYLSGDDPDTRQYEGWDPVLARWPHWSEMYASRWAFEGGMPGSYTNLHRATVGASAHPTAKLGTFFDYSALWADKHGFGTNYIAPPPIPQPYGDGYFRGHLLVGRVTYSFCKYIDSHVILEYFIPGSYYDSVADDALFFRWEVAFKF